MGRADLQASDVALTTRSWKLQVQHADGELRALVQHVLELEELLVAALVARPGRVIHRHCIDAVGF